MKKYKEYMDRISLSQEAREKILDAMARGEKPREMQAPAQRQASAGEKHPLELSTIFRFGSMAAALVICLILGSVVLSKKNAQNVSATGGTDAHITEIAQEQSSGVAAGGTMAMDAYASMASVSLKNSAAPAEPASIVGNGMQNTESVFLIRIKDGLLTCYPLSAGDRELIHAYTRTPGMRLSDYSSAAQPEAGIWIQIGQDYWQFLPDQADADALQTYQRLLEEAGYND